MIKVYAFDEFALDEQRFELRRAGERIHLEPKAFSLLAYLIRARQRVVPLDELHERLWADEFVTNSAVTRCPGPHFARDRVRPQGLTPV